jgi:hypothetical protein
MQQVPNSLTFYVLVNEGRYFYISSEAVRHEGGDCYFLLNPNRSTDMLYIARISDLSTRVHDGDKSGAFL